VGQNVAEQEGQKHDQNGVQDGVSSRKLLHKPELQDRKWARSSRA
jgi:hypothetical protein